MDHQMLTDIVNRAVARFAKANWMPPMLEVADLRQEAWVAVLEAQEAGIIDPEELQRLAELRIKRIMRKELKSPTLPVSWQDEITEETQEAED